MSLQHVKPHGGLYHLASRRPDIAEAVVAAANDAGLLLVVGPPGSKLEDAARRRGLGFAAEGFADRHYCADGNLLARSDPRALVEGDDEAVAARAVTFVRDGRVATASGTEIPLGVQTLCLHGDDPRAARRARAVRRALEQAGIAVAPLGVWLR